MKRLSIIIPVYNEKNTIINLLDLVDKVELSNIEKEIIIIDDYSVDGTREILKGLSSQYNIIFKDKNEGKGAAVREGFQRATGDLLIIQDADLEYNPNEFMEMFEPIISNNADVVYGSRFISNKPRRVLYFWHYIGNKMLTTLSNMLTNLTLTDMETCYKAFNRKAIDFLKDKLSSNRFGIEPQLTSLVAKGKFRIYEVGISYFGRTYEEGKKINWRDGVAAIWYIIKYNLFSK